MPVLWRIRENTDPVACTYIAHVRLAHDNLPVYLHVSFWVAVLPQPVAVV